MKILKDTALMEINEMTIPMFPELQKKIKPW